MIWNGFEFGIGLILSMLLFVLGKKFFYWHYRGLAIRLGLVACIVIASFVWAYR